MKSNTRKLLQLGCYITILSLICLALSACLQPIGKRTRGGDGGTLPRYHVWGLLNEMDSEETGYAMYTYVLFPRRLDFSAGVEPETRERYKTLLDSIVASTLGTEEADQLPKEETNLFYIPAIGGGKKPGLENYNSTLAMRYLLILSRLARDSNRTLAERLSVRPGPFLISTLKPLGEIGKDQADLLYTDLSGTNPAAMVEIVAAYKRRISIQDVKEIERFWPLRLALLNLILNADDNVKLVKVALAEWKP